MKSFILFIITSFLIVSGCKKDTSPIEPEQKEYTEELEYLTSYPSYDSTMITNFSIKYYYPDSILFEFAHDAGIIRPVEDPPFSFVTYFLEFKNSGSEFKSIMMVKMEVENNQVKLIAKPNSQLPGVLGLELFRNAYYRISYRVSGVLGPYPPGDINSVRLIVFINKNN